MNLPGTWPLGRTWQPPPRVTGLLTVLAVHGWLLLAALQAPAPDTRREPPPANQRQPLWWLLPPTKTETSSASTAARRPQPRPEPSDTPRSPALPPAGQGPLPEPVRESPPTQGPAWTAEPRPTESAPVASDGQADGTASTAQPTPLRLALPRRPPASEPPPAALATQNPRLQGTRSASARFAETLGTDLSLKMQPLEGGGHRLQQGHRCVELRPARESRLNPFDPSARNLPPQATGC